MALTALKPKGYGLFRAMFSSAEHLCRIGALVVYAYIHQQRGVSTVRKLTIGEMTVGLMSSHR